MGIIAKSTGGDFELVEAGSYIARCIKVIDIGTQPSWNPDQRAQRKVMITWELLEDEDGEAVRMQDGRPFAINATYTLSISPKANLRKVIDSWRGIPFTDEESQGFDITNLLGAYCRIGVVHEPAKNDPSKTYANVSTVGFTKKKPEGVNDTFWWSVEDSDMTRFNDFPDFLKEKIQKSDEFQAAQAFPNIAQKQDTVAEYKDDEPINLDEISY